MIAGVGDIFLEDCSGSGRGKISMSIKTIAVCLVMASYLMNSDDISTDLPSACLFFSALQDAFIVKKKHLTTLFKVTDNRHFLLVSMLSEPNTVLCCSPVSHCHSSVECRSSALIDSEAHDPVSKVKGHFWCDFCCYSNNSPRERAIPHTKQPQLGLR